MIFEMSGPAKVLFGRKVRAELPPLLPEGNVFIICGAHAEARIRKELLPRLAGRKTELFSSVPAEAPLDAADAALESARRINARSVIGWGGGSCIDGAKTVAALLDSGLTAAQCFRENLAAPERSCFFAALPTTAGTAAEMTPNAVLCDHSTSVKKSLRGSSMFADAALIDPELLEEAPLKVLFSSGFDALTQGIESTISAKADAMTQLFSVEGAFLTWQGLRRLAAGSREAEVFDMLARGCMLSGAAFVKSGLGAVHGIGHPVSGLKGVPHGVCCAILLPAVLEWNLPVSGGGMKALARRFSLNSPEELIAEIVELRRKCGLPENFKSWNLAPADFPFVVKNCRSGSMKSNPRPFSDEEVAALLESLI
ncbi:MAG: iron-containing alcohol dehydrogenase [Lentisphaeria bacterium]|nr:iron-containing alcohol dehydrogenase [Lentisphaeria bacterium]